MNQTKKKIMIMDDDAAIVDAITMMLEFEGYEVISTSDATNLLSSNVPLPDLLLLDIWMSGTDGRDICKHLKQSRKTKALPIVLVSASREIEKSARDSGADDFLSKPFEANDLLQKIEMHL
jgi:DNA-binding response OmpR family regulator